MKSGMKSGKIIQSLMWTTQFYCRAEGWDKTDTKWCNYRVRKTWECLNLQTGPNQTHCHDSRILDCSINTSLALSRLLFTVYQLSDRKESAHSWEPWDAFAANCHPSTERSPGKVCTGPKNTPAASSSATCHLKVTTGQFATWTTCYLCSFVFFFFSPSRWTTSIELLIQQQKPKTTPLICVNGSAMNWPLSQDSWGWLDLLAWPWPQEERW